MPSRSLNALLLLAPAAALGLFAWLASRHPATPKADAATLNSGPFQVSIRGVEKIPVSPIDLFQGYDTKFRVIFEGRGQKPAGWGAPINSSSGSPTKPWAFLTEQQGQRKTFKPSKIEAWTTRYDEKRKLYYNEVLLHTGPLATNTALKVKGSTRIANGTTVFGPALAFEQTLKVANQPWKTPTVSTNPGVTVRSIKVVKKSEKERSAKIELYIPNIYNEQERTGWQDGGTFLNAKWQEFHHIERGNNPWKGCWMVVEHSFGGDSDMSPYPKRTSDRVQTYEFTWSNADLATDPARDVIAVMHLSFNNRWPLEIAFYAKKDGKPTFGPQTLLQRPKPAG